MHLVVDTLLWTIVQYVYLCIGAYIKARTHIELLG